MLLFDYWLTDWLNDFASERADWLLMIGLCVDWSLIVGAQIGVFDHIGCWLIFVSGMVCNCLIGWPVVLVD